MKPNPLDPTLRNLNDCGCCAGTQAETPAAIENRPGLPAIAFRAGTHARFKASLLAALSAAGHPQLGKLRMREDDDFTIALLDAFSAMADVLTFYSERMANEAYLLTATERRSVLELARAIGYELRPGVAASTWLAFTVEDAPGAPGSADIPARTKVQSVPGPNEKPQFYETIEAITAQKQWNQLLPLSRQFVAPFFGQQQIRLQGVATNLKPGDTLLIVGNERRENVGNENWDFRRVTEVQTFPDADPAKAFTLVTLHEPLGKTVRFRDAHGVMQVRRIYPARQNAKVYAMRARANLFGHGAPEWLALGKDVRAAFGHADTSTGVSLGDWPDFTIAAVTGINPQGTSAAIALDAVYSSIARDTWVVLSTSEYQEAYLVTSVTETAPHRFTLTHKVTQLGIEEGRQPENLFEKFNGKLRETAVFAQSELLDWADTPTAEAIAGRTIVLDRQVEGLAKGRALIIQGRSFAGDSRTEAAQIASVDTAATMLADGSSQTLTKLTLEADLIFSYDPASVVIFANVAPATHGETVEEIVGHGDASQPHQQFTLKQAPLTFTPANTPTGSESSLEVYVNDVEWAEADSLYARGPRERVFVARREDDGTTRLVFGDGKFGALLPTGIENIRARYRKGVGLAGNVKAGQLTLLMNRPLGVKAVVNPDAAGGAQDPERLDEAQRNAPLQTLTLGRVVSLQDYEDFARAYSGIAKAHAVWVWTPQGRGVFVSVALPGGAPLPTSSQLLDELRAALDNYGNPLVPVRVALGAVTPFALAGRIVARPDRIPDRVKAAVDAALTSQFSFDSRSFGANVALSEVVALIQNVPGVDYVDLTALKFATRAADHDPLNPILFAARPLPGAAMDKTHPAPAEVLVVAIDSLLDLKVSAP